MCSKGRIGNGQHVDTAQEKGELMPERQGDGMVKDQNTGERSEETLLQMAKRIGKRARELDHEGCDSFCLKCAFEGLSDKLRSLHELQRYR